jgi:hypothetical protein
MVYGMFPAAQLGRHSIRPCLVLAVRAADAMRLHTRTQHTPNPLHTRIAVPCSCCADPHTPPRMHVHVRGQAAMHALTHICCEPLVLLPSTHTEGTCNSAKRARIHAYKHIDKLLTAACRLAVPRYGPWAQHMRHTSSPELRAPPAAPRALVARWPARSRLHASSSLRVAHAKPEARPRNKQLSICSRRAPPRPLSIGCWHLVTPGCLLQCVKTNRQAARHTKPAAARPLKA